MKNKYHKMAGELDQIGLMISIIKISKKNFNFLINGESIKSFKQRRSCNKRIEKLHKENIRYEN